MFYEHNGQSKPLLKLVGNWLIVIESRTLNTTIRRIQTSFFDQRMGNGTSENIVTNEISGRGEIMIDVLRR